MKHRETEEKISNLSNFKILRCFRYPLWIIFRCFQCPRWLTNRTIRVTIPFPHYPVFFTPVTKERHIFGSIEKSKALDLPGKEKEAMAL